MLSTRVPGAPEVLPFFQLVVTSAQAALSPMLSLEFKTLSPELPEQDQIIGQAKG